MVSFPNYITEKKYTEYVVLYTEMSHALVFYILSIHFLEYVVRSQF